MELALLQFAEFDTPCILWVDVEDFGSIAFASEIEAYQFCQYLTSRGENYELHVQPTTTLQEAIAFFESENGEHPGGTGLDE